VLELVEGGGEAGAGLGAAHRLGHVPLVDNDLGGGVAEVSERSGRVRTAARSMPSSGVIMALGPQNCASFSAGSVRHRHTSPRGARNTRR